MADILQTTFSKTFLYITIVFDTKFVRSGSIDNRLLPTSVVLQPEPMLAMCRDIYVRRLDLSSQSSINLQNLKHVIRAPVLHLDVS